MTIKFFFFTPQFWVFDSFDETKNPLWSSVTNVGILIDYWHKRRKPTLTSIDLPLWSFFLLEIRFGTRFRIFNCHSEYFRPANRVDLQTYKIINKKGKNVGLRATVSSNRWQWVVTMSIWDVKTHLRGWEDMLKWRKSFFFFFDGFIKITWKVPFLHLSRRKQPCTLI